VTELTEAAEMTDPISTRVRFAVHEAGHAIVARFLGLPLGDVTLDHAEGSGSTEVRFSDVGATDRETLATVIAGQLAERAVGFPYIADSADDDTLAATLESRMATADIAASAGMVDDILNTNRSALLGLAAVLYYLPEIGIRSMTGRQAAGVIDKVGNVIDSVGNLDRTELYNALPPILQWLADYDSASADSENEPLDYMGPVGAMANGRHRVPGKAVTGSPTIPHIFEADTAHCVTCGKTAAEGPHMG
jgi:hypothetical protein